MCSISTVKLSCSKNKSHDTSNRQDSGPMLGTRNVMVGQECQMSFCSAPFSDGFWGSNVKTGNLSREIIWSLTNSLFILFTLSAGTRKEGHEKREKEKGCVIFVTTFRAWMRKS